MILATLSELSIGWLESYWTVYWLYSVLNIAELSQALVDLYAEWFYSIRTVFWVRVLPNCLLIILNYSELSQAQTALYARRFYSIWTVYWVTRVLLNCLLIALNVGELSLESKNYHVTQKIIKQWVYFKKHCVNSFRKFCELALAGDVLAIVLHLVVVCYNLFVWSSFHPRQPCDDCSLGDIGRNSWFLITQNWLSDFTKVGFILFIYLYYCAEITNDYNAQI